MAINKLLTTLGAVFALSLSLPTFAHYASSGVMLGGQLGYGNTDYNRDAFGFGMKEGGVAGRVYMGNQFNRYIGLELGAAVYSSAKLDSALGKVRTEQLDLLLRIGAPVAETGLRADVKLGAAAIFADMKPTAAGKLVGFEENSVSGMKPEAGVSVSYYFSRSAAVELSYVHVFGNPNSESHPLPRADLALFGIGYLFASS